jgi:hypothetical protein
MQDTQIHNYCLSDTSIAGFMQILQAALMTGTDMLDFMRMLRFEPNEKMELMITKESAMSVEKYCNDVLAKLEELQKNG